MCISDQILLFKQNQHFFQEKSTRAREFLNSYGYSIPFLSRVIGYMVNCFSLEEIYTDGGHSFHYEEIKNSIEKIGSDESAQSSILLPTLTTTILYSYSHSIQKVQQQVELCFTPPISSFMKSFLEMIIPTALYVISLLSFFSLVTHSIRLVYNQLSEYHFYLSYNQSFSSTHYRSYNPVSQSTY